jgi:hypothetical protein
LPDGYQAGVDLGIVFLGMFCAYCAASIRDRSSDVRLIESIIFGLVLFGAVVLPIFFILVWLLWIAGVTNEFYFFDIVWKWITETAIMVSTIIAGIHYLRGTRDPSVSA